MTDILKLLILATMTVLLSVFSIMGVAYVASIIQA